MASIAQGARVMSLLANEHACLDRRGGGVFVCVRV